MRSGGRREFECIGSGRREFDLINYCNHFTKGLY